MGSPPKAGPSSGGKSLTAQFLYNAFSRAESLVHKNIEKQTGYRILEFYAKSANEGVPFPTANFVLDKIK